MSKEIIGGQALVEGVMMVNGNKKAIAVRNPEGEIVIKKEPLNAPKSKIAKLPLIRGVVNMFFMMSIGMKALNYSTSIAFNEKEEDMSGWKMIFFLLFSMSIALLIFKFVPLLITKFIVGKSLFLQSNNFLPNLIDGIIKISIFILYVYLISLSKDTRKVFQYHGAEHKTVYCQENKEPLTVKNVKKFSRLHPRCGTAFVFGVFMISILIYTLIPFNSTTFLQNFGLRILLLPLVAGISYEALKISGKKEGWFFDIITAPGLWMQKLTTKEPNEKQIEVAIASLKAAMKK